ncbi:MAG: T9SS type A sorting domain-containing protein, partial [Bacteroidota bacterium]
VNTGKIRFKVSKNAFRLLDEVALDLNQNGSYEASEIVLQQGNDDGIFAEQIGTLHYAHQGTPLRIEIEEQGPMKVVLKVEGRHYDSQGGYFLKYETRIYAFADQAYLRIRHSYANGTPVASLGDSGAEWLKETVDRYGISLQPQLSGTLSLSFGLDGQTASTTLDGDNWALTQQDRATVQVPWLAQVQTNGTNSSSGNRADGWLTLADNNWGIGIAARHFWEKYPKGLEIDATGKLTLLPAPSPVDFWAAQGTSEEFVLHFFPAGEAAAAQTLMQGLGKTPVKAYVSPDQYVESQAFYKLHQGYAAEWPNLDDFIQTTTNNHLANRETLDLYGYLHFGDVPRSQWELDDTRTWSTWGNNYYDCLLTNARMYALTGDVRYFDVMEPMAWHFMETQCFQPYEANNWMNGYSPSYSIHHRGIGHYNHHYGEGIWYYYYLTGDERARELGLRAANSIKNAHLWGLDNPNARLAYQNGSACLEAWKATGDTSFLNTFKTYAIDRILFTQNSYGLIGAYSAEGGLNFPGEQSFMIALFADCVWKYLQHFPEDQPTANQLVSLAEFINEYARETPGQETYLNFWQDPSLPGVPQPWFTNTLDDYVYWTGRALISGLYAYAYDVSGDTRFRDMAEATMEHVWGSAYGEAEGNFGWGKAASEAMKNTLHTVGILLEGSNVSIDEPVHTSLLKLYPNPTTGRIFLPQPATSSPYPYAIYQLDGKEIQKGTIQSGQQELSVELLKPGLYLIKTAAGMGKFVRE